MFQVKKLTKVLFKDNYLLRVSAAHNTLKYSRTLSARHRAKCAIFREVRRSTSSERKAVSAILFQRTRVSGLFFRADYLARLSAAHNTSKYWRTLYRHVTGRNVRFSDFSPSSAVEVVETKRSIGNIVA